MMVLGVDAAASTVSVAVSKKDQIIGELWVGHSQQASVLLPQLAKRVLELCELNLEDLQGVAVTTGPGSFTGLRIACAWAAGLGFSLGLPTVGVGTLESLVAAAPVNPGEYALGALDARGGAVFGALFQRSGAEDGRQRFWVPTRLFEPGRYEPEAILELAGTHLADFEIMWWVGTGSIPKAPQLRHHPSDVRASAVAYLGWRQLQMGADGDPRLIHPHYYRATEAERKGGQWGEGPND